MDNREQEIKARANVALVVNTIITGHKLINHRQDDLFIKNYNKMSVWEFVIPKNKYNIFDKMYYEAPSFDERRNNDFKVNFTYIDRVQNKIYPGQLYKKQVSCSKRGMIESFKKNLKYTTIYNQDGAKDYYSPLLPREALNKLPNTIEECCANWGDPDITLTEADVAKLEAKNNELVEIFSTNKKFVSFLRDSIKECEDYNYGVTRDITRDNAEYYELLQNKLNAIQDLSINCYQKNKTSIQKAENAKTIDKDFDSMR